MASPAQIRTAVEDGRVRDSQLLDDPRTLEVRPGEERCNGAEDPRSVWQELAEEYFVRRRDLVEARAHQFHFLQLNAVSNECVVINPVWKPPLDHGLYVRAPPLVLEPADGLPAEPVDKPHG